jgi:GNAT superfamily N-acetyltransferase
MMRVREALVILRSRQGVRWLRQTVRLRLHSRRIAIGVRRDLNVHVPVGPPKIPLVVRHLQPDDDLSFIEDAPGLSPRAAAERTVQRWLLGSNLPPPAVAIDADGKVCFMAWMLTERDNDVIRARWGEMLPQLKPGEALIEGPFTAESHRGKGVMLAYNAILDAARDSGLRYVMGFIAEGNIAQLKVAEIGGFVPFTKREESWFLFRRRVRFLPVTDNQVASPTSA